jgi:hypothetical protein
MLVVLPDVFGGRDAQDVVGGHIGLALARRQGDAADKGALLGLDDDFVADPEVKVAGVAELRRTHTGDADVYEPGEIPSIF